MSEALRFAPALGRIMMAIIFIWAGYGKVTDFAGSVGYAESAGMPMASIAIALAILIELGGGIALILGFKARLAAGALAVFCVLAAVIFHRNLSDYNEFLFFWKDITIAGGLLQVVYFGAGPLSMDNRGK